MKCDRCNKAAVVHEVTVKDGVKTEMHLCEEHATAKGITLPDETPINQLLTQFVICKENRPNRRIKCGTCGSAFATFRRSGLLGCAECYTAFEEHLAPMIERAQNGGTSHAGKCPRRGGATIDQQVHMQRLFKELEDAVAAEEYEKAAQIRDRLRDLNPDATESAPPPAAG